MSPTRPVPAELDNQFSRRGPLFAAIWLVFLFDPIREGWANATARSAGVLGIVATIAFGTVYMLAWLRLRQDRASAVHQATDPHRLVLVPRPAGCSAY